MNIAKLTKRMLAVILTLALLIGGVSAAVLAEGEGGYFLEPEGISAYEYDEPVADETEPNYGEYIADGEDDAAVPDEDEGEVTAGIAADGYSVTIEAASTPNLNTTTVTFTHDQNVIDAVVGDVVVLGTEVEIHVANAAAANIRQTTPVTVQAMKDGLPFDSPFTDSWLRRDSDNPHNLLGISIFMHWGVGNIQLADAGSYTFRIYIGGVFAVESAPITVNVAASAPPPDLSTTIITVVNEWDVIDAVVGDIAQLLTFIEINVVDAAAANIRPTTPITIQPMKDGLPSCAPFNTTFLRQDPANPNNLIGETGSWWVWLDDIQLANAGSYTTRIYIGGVLIGESLPIVLNVAQSAPPPDLSTTTVTFSNDRDQIFAAVGSFVALGISAEINIANAAVANIRPTTPVTVQMMKNGLPFDGHTSLLGQDSSNPNNLIGFTGIGREWFYNVQRADAGSYTLRIYIGGVFAGESSPTILNVTAGGGGGGGWPPPPPPPPELRPPPPIIQPILPDTGSDRERGSGGGGGSSGSGGGSSRSSDGASRVLSALTPTPLEMWADPPTASRMMQSAVTENQNFTRSRHDGRQGVRAAAWQNLAGMRYDHDTTDARGVQVRMSILSPVGMTEDMLVSAWVTGNDVNRVRSLFENWFSGNMRVVHFDHAGAWGQTVRVAARVDLTGMDADNLYFYSFDSAENRFRRIPEPNHRVDVNGFLHFSVDTGGAVVISDGPLTRR